MLEASKRRFFFETPEEMTPAASGSCLESGRAHGASTPATRATLLDEIQSRERRCRPTAVSRVACFVRETRRHLSRSLERVSPMIFGKRRREPPPPPHSTSSRSRSRSANLSHGESRFSPVFFRAIEYSIESLSRREVFPRVSSSRFGLSRSIRRVFRERERESHL